MTPAKRLAILEILKRPIRLPVPPPLYLQELAQQLAGSPSVEAVGWLREDGIVWLQPWGQPDDGERRAA